MITAFGLAWAWAYFSSFAVLLIDADGGMLFSFWGRFLNDTAARWEQSGTAWKVFFLKPLGLCSYCFTTWLSIFGAVFCWQVLGGYFLAYFVLFVGWNYKVMSE